MQTLKFRSVLAVMLTLITLLTSVFVKTPAVSHAQGNDGGASFTNLTFSTTSSGAPMTYFPTGTKQIFARFNYNNIPGGPLGSTLHREWYLNGKLSIQKDEGWNPAWGSDGTLTTLSIQDFTEGLTPGYYHVIVSLNYEVAVTQVTGDFAIADRPVAVIPSDKVPAFSNLTLSSSPAAAPIVTFPYFTPIVSARWDYANIPIGAIMERDWYLNGEIFNSVQEPWSADWGSSGRLTHVALYDYQNGLAPGAYQLNIFLRDLPYVKVTAIFAIGDGTRTGPFSNLTFSTTPTGLPMGIFPHTTRDVFARWDFTNVSPQSVLVRRWFRNGAMWLERRQAWTYGPTGSVQNISIYDHINGMLPGDYRLEVSLDGVPNSVLVGYFTIQ